MGDTKNAKMEMIIPEEFIANTVRAEMVAALGKNGGPERLVEAIVKSALEAKANDYYSRDKTIFIDGVEKLVRNMATEAFQEWMEVNKPLIKKAVAGMLKENYPSLVEQIVAGLLEGAKKMEINLALNIAKSKEF